MAVVLSRRLPTKSVNKATAELFPIASPPRAMLDTGEAGLKRYIHHRAVQQQAANIIKSCSAC